MGSTGTGGTSGSGGVTGGGTGGHAGGSGNGGAIGSGGVTGSGGSSSGTGGSVQMSATGQFTVVYAGSVTSVLSNCYSCTARYNASTSTATLNDSMDNSSGTLNKTGVAVVIQPATGGGQQVYVGLSETNPTLAAQYQGLYTLGTGTAMYAPLTGSCVTTTQLDLRNGGGIAGSLNCAVVGGSGTSPIHAQVTGTFSGTFAP